MPAHHFRTGDMCGLDIIVCNPGQASYPGVPLFVILDVYGSYFFGPSFTEFDFYRVDVSPGTMNMEVLPMFSWPSGTGAADGVLWYAAMTDQAITELFGELDSWEFGWSE